MRPTTGEYNKGFFEGLKFALAIAQKKKRGNTSAQVAAIAREINRLALMQEVHKL